MIWKAAADAVSTHLDRLQRVFDAYPALHRASFVSWPNGTFHMTDLECEDVGWAARDEIIRAVGASCADLSPAGIGLAWAIVIDGELGGLSISRQDVQSWTSQPQITWATSELPALQVVLQRTRSPQPVGPAPYTLVQAAHACRAMQHLDDVRVDEPVFAEISPRGIALGR